MLKNLNINKEFRKDKIINLLIYILPAALITGPLIPEIIVFILSIFIVNKIINEKKYFIIKNKVVLIYLFFFFTICLSSLLSEHVFSSIRSSFFYIRFGLFGIAVLYIIERNDKNFYKIFLYSILITLFFLLSNGFLEFLFKKNIIFGTALEDSKRITSFFGDEKIMGGYLLRLLPLILYLMFKTKMRKEYIITICTLILIGIIISGERTSIILSLILIFFLFFINYDLKKKILFFLSLILLFCIFLLTNPSLYERLVFETYRDIFNNPTDFLNYNIFSAGHTYYFIASIQIFFDNLIIGVGPNLFRIACSNPEYIINANSCSTHSHNFYFQLLAETGILGFLFLIGLFFFVSIRIFKAMTNIKFLENYNYCLLLSVFINIFPISSHGNFFNNWISIMLFLPIPFLLKEFNLITFKK